MIIKYFRAYLLSFVAFCLLCPTLHAADSADTIKVLSEGSSRPHEVPVDIVKMCPVLDNMMEGLGGYKAIPEVLPILGIKAALFTQFIDFLKAIKTALGAKDLSEVTKPALRNAFEAELLPQKNDSAQLLRLITAANFLGVNEAVAIGTKNWAKNYAKMPSGFNDLNDALKEVIIGHLTPKEFMALVSANAREDLEGSFNIALKVHYDETVPEGETAKHYYENLRQISGFVRIPGGQYEIGSPETELNHRDNEKLHRVTLSPFSIMEATVTQEDYEKVTGTNPSYDQKTGNYPVENVTWIDAEAFAKKKSQNDPNYNYRLPTEAEIEVAFRGGTKTAYVSGDDEASIDKYVWYDKNLENKTHPAKSTHDNDYGIYRSSVWEWTQDWYDKDYCGSEGLDPIGPTKGSSRVIRGGSFCSNAQCCRSAYRSSVSPARHGSFLGFRLVRTKK